MPTDNPNSRTAEALLPCPFCGAADPHLKLNAAERHVVAHVECQSCGAHSRDVVRAFPEHPASLAVAAWNTRATDNTALIEAMEPFANACTIGTAEDAENIDDTIAATRITWGDLRRARTALAQANTSLDKGE